MPQIEVTRKFKMVIDGMTLSCSLSAAPDTDTAHVEDKIVQLERFMANPDQYKLEFDIATQIAGARLRADQPKIGDKEFSFGIDVTGLSLQDRATIYNYAQTGAKVTVKIIELEKGRKPATQEAKPAETAEEAKPATEEPKLVEAPNMKWFNINTIEERLLAALYLKAGAEGRWAERRTAGLTDADLTKAIVQEFTRARKDPADDFHVNPDRAHFLGVVKAGEPKFYLAPQPGMAIKINSKATLQGARLLEKVREVLSIPKPEPKRLSGSPKEAARAN